MTECLILVFPNCVSYQLWDVLDAGSRDEVDLAY